MKKINNLSFFLALFLFVIFNNAFSQTKCEINNVKDAIKMTKKEFKSHPYIFMIEMPGALGYFEIKPAYENDASAINLAEELNSKAFENFLKINDCPSSQEPHTNTTSDDAEMSAMATKSVTSSKISVPHSSAKFSKVLETTGSCRSCRKNTNLGNQTTN